MIRLTDDQRDLLRAALDLAFASEESGLSTDYEKLDPIADALVKAAQHSNVVVLMAWNPEKGDCYECGLPAAYVIDGDHAGLGHPLHTLRCSVCAARAASEGECIVYLYEED